MTAKQYLLSYRNIERRYKTIIEQIKSIESEMISLKSPGFDERVQTSPKKDPIGEMVCNLEKEKGRLGMRLTECRAKMFLMQKQVSDIEDISNDYYVILLFRYILFKDWQSICDILHLSRAQANKLHGFALVEFDQKFSKFYADK